MYKLLIATHNPGKLREYRQLLADLPLEIVSLAELGIAVTVAETGTTFAANAGQKAAAYAQISGLWTWTDDSGLEVDALQGAPGVRSARYGGPDADDAERYRKLLRELDGVEPARRTARFRCAVALNLLAEGVLTAEGVLEGRIATVARGSHGFGYDPVFLVGNGARTLAELSPREKNQISHRSIAARRAKAALQEFLRKRR